MTAAQIDTRKVEQGGYRPLVERRHDEFVASYAVQHWLDVTARRKTVAITLRDLEPFDRRPAPLSRPMSRHLPVS